MNVKMILPALTEALSPHWRPIKYSLFPPLGLATLAGYLDTDDQVTLQDEHVEPLDLGDEPDLVAIQVYVTSARRAYELADHYRARGAWSKDSWAGRLRHLAYAGGWKKLEPLWDAVIRARQVSHMLPLLEAVLAGRGRSPRSTTPTAQAPRPLTQGELA